MKHTSHVIIATVALTLVGCGTRTPADLISGQERCGLKAELTAPTLPGGKQEVSYCVQNGIEIMEGDIILPTARFGALVGDLAGSLESFNPLAAGVLNAEARPSALWPDKRIPYELDPELEHPDRVEEAIAHWHQHTSIKLVPRTTQTDYVYFRAVESGCSSRVGRTGGEQAINLAASCETGSIIHEIGHAVGLWHEQSRNDRDDHITIVLQNISRTKRHNFQKYAARGKEAGPYDIGSIMHYSSFAFSNNGEATIVVKETGETFRAQRGGLSDLDIAGIGHLYRRLTESGTGP